MLKTGISRSELLGLTWSNIDFDNRFISIRHGVADVKDTATNKWTVVIGEPKNDFRKRDVPINSELVEMLKVKYNTREMKVDGSRRKKIEPKSILPEYVFPDNRGQAYSPKNWSVRVFDTFMADLTAAKPAIPALNAHELRHTFATILKNDDVDLFLLAKLMGHADFNMLYKRYAHTDIEQLRKALGA